MSRGTPNIDGWRRSGLTGFGGLRAVPRTFTTGVLGCRREGVLMTITRRDWWAGIAVLTAALLLNSVHGLYAVSWTYWLTH